MTKLAQIYEEKYKELKLLLQNPQKPNHVPHIKKLACSEWQSMHHKKESILLQYKVLMCFYVVWCCALSLLATEMCIPLLATQIQQLVCGVKRNLKYFFFHLGFAGSDVIWAIPVVQRWGFCTCRLSEFK